MITLLQEPWPWYVAGPLTSLVMFLMLYFGKAFGVSSTFRTMCSIGGAGRISDFFRFNWKSGVWNLTFVLGAVLGGFIASNFMMPSDAIQLSEETEQSLTQLGVANPGENYLPPVFEFGNLLSFRGIIFMIFGGFLVGFGTRYAGGCTSGHAISGLSNLQIPSLIAVVGFFIGGLFVTHLIIPHIL